MNWMLDRGTGDNFKHCGLFHAREVIGAVCFCSSERERETERERERR